MPKVVIIGSGISAMAAARELSQNGIKVIILEAMNRVGGRIHTKKIDDRNYDLGASWMHDTLMNPLFLECVKEGFTLEYDDESHGYYTKNGPIPKDLNAPAVVKDFNDMMRLDYGLGKFRRPDMTLQKYAIEFVNTWPLISERNKELVPRIIQFNELWTGVPWDKAGAATTLLDFMGRDAFMIDGMSSIYEWVRKAVDWSKAEIHTDSQVDRISKTAEGYSVSTKNQTFDADYVICTVPLGGLANFHTTLFDMELPNSLRHSMNEGVMGALGKVVLEFGTRWWDDKHDQYKYIVDEDASKNLEVKPGNQPVDIINAFRKYPTQNQHSLVVLTAPPLTQFVEANPDKAFAHLLPALESIRSSPDIEIPEPKRVFCTEWTLNPWINGSYSGLKMGQKYDEIIQPFIDGADRLRFAGEHTVYDGNGCVHGAYASGLREAAWISEDIA